jgi:hypothetical protein
VICVTRAGGAFSGRTSWPRYFFDAGIACGCARRFKRVYISCRSAGLDSSSQRTIGARGVWRRKCGRKRKRRREAKIVRRAVHIAAFIFMGVAAASTALKAADDAAAATFVSLKLEGSCDAQNNRLWLPNTHTIKTEATTVRWRAAGGKDLPDQFYPGPNSVREIGCAAEAELLEAKFADF